MATQLAERRADPVVVIRQNLERMAPEFQAALPKHVSVEKFTRVAMTAIQNNPDLVNVDRRSLFGAIVRLAQDGLLPDGREAAIVKFGDKAQAMPMIAGILKKVRQSGEVAYVSAQVVYEKDHFIWKLGFNEDVEHNPPKLDQPRGKPIGAYATAVLKDGSRLLEVMSLDEIEKVRAVSRAKNNGPWVAWWGEMARKTVMRRLSKRLPMSTDLDNDFERDETLAHVDTPPPAAIEHAPMNRLDTLEHQIVGKDEIEDAEVVDAETGEITDRPSPAETLAPDVAAGTAGDPPTSVEQEEATDSLPGRDDSQMGEAHTTVDIEADIVAHIGRKTRVLDVQGIVNSRGHELDEDGLDRVRVVASDRIAEIRAAEKAQADA